MKKLFGLIIFSIFIIGRTTAQEYFTINDYTINVKVNKNASLDVTEKINVHFTEQRHGIIRKIPYKYKLQPLPNGVQQAERQMQSGGYSRTIIENIKVLGFKYETSNSGDYKLIKIGSADKYVDGDQQYIITYHVLNAINFFKDHAELYFNVIGDQWATTVAKANFTIELPEPISDTSTYFVATGVTGSKENNTRTKWEDNKTFSGTTIQPLNANEGVTVGINLPNNYLTKPDYRFNGIYWLLLPLLVFAGIFYIWKRWGKDDHITIQTEFYPPENISPAISGYIIDGKLDRRDLTALVPYWGAGGYLKINETDEKHLLGLYKTKEYEFVKLKELNEDAPTFEKTFFNGIFISGDHVKLSDLKDVLYISMNKAKDQLKKEIDRNDYYVKYSRGMAGVFTLLGIVGLIYSIIKLLNLWYENKWLGIALVASAILILIFGLLMSKKTVKGNEVCQKLLGFKEFVRSVEKDRLQEFLKQDANYFDKVLPYAIVFNVADKWKDKFKGLDIPPPTWYSGAYSGNTFSTHMFMNNLDNSMRSMSNTFYSAPNNSGSSGSSFGGGGSSGGGFGGGGGSSW